MLWKVIRLSRKETSSTIGGILSFSRSIFPFFFLFFLFLKRAAVAFTEQSSDERRRAQESKVKVERNAKRQRKHERERETERVIGKEGAVRPVNRCRWKPLIRQTLHRLTTTRPSQRLVHIQDFVRLPGNMYLYVHIPSTAACCPPAHR